MAPPRHFRRKYESAMITAQMKHSCEARGAKISFGRAGPELLAFFCWAALSALVAVGQAAARRRTAAAQVLGVLPSPSLPPPRPSLSLSPSSPSPSVLLHPPLWPIPILLESKPWPRRPSAREAPRPRSGWPRARAQKAFDQDGDKDRDAIRIIVMIGMRIGLRGKTSRRSEGGRDKKEKEE